MTSRLPVSVVIPTRNRPELLRATVESILAADCVPAELVVADQSPDPEPLPVSDEVEVVHLRLSSVGLSRGRNAGIGAARQIVLAFTDDDVQVEADWLCRLVEPLLAASEPTVVTGAVLAPKGIEAEGYIPSLTSLTEPRTFSGRLFADPLFPNNMALPSSVFAAIGDFDERLGAGVPSAGSGGEDNDIGFRLLDAGYRIEFVPDAVVYHYGVRRGRDLLSLYWSYGRGQGAFYAKHMSLADRYMLRRFWRNVRFRLRRLAPALRGERQAVREGIYLAGLFWGAPIWWWRYGRGSRSGAG